MSAGFDPDNTAVTLARHDEQIKHLVEWQRDQNGTLRDIRTSLDTLQKETNASLAEMAKTTDEKFGSLQKVLVTMLGGVATSTVLLAINILVKG